MVFFSVRALEGTTKKILYALLFITPLLFWYQLYFPFTTSKAYALRLLVGIAFFFWAVLLMRSRPHRPDFKNPLVIGLLVFLVGYVVTGLLGVDPMRSFFSTAERSDGVIQFGVWVLYFLMVISVFRTRHDWHIALAILVAVGFLSSIFGLLKLESQGLIYGTLGNPSYLGAFLLFSIGFSALFLLRTFSPFRNPSRLRILLPITLLMLFFAVVIVLTQTRGDYIGFLAGLMTFAVLSHFLPGKTAHLKKLIIGFDIALLSLFAFLGFLLTNPHASFVEQTPLLRRIANSAETNSVLERLTEWRIALQGFQDRPVFGWGAENFISVSNKHYDYRVGLIDQWFDRPHNQSLQILAEGGIVLFGAYLFVVGTIIFFLYQIFKREPLVGAVVAALFAAYFAQDFFLFDTFATYIGFFTLVGFVYFLYREHYPARAAESQEVSAAHLSKGQEALLPLLAFGAAAAFVWYTVWIPYRANPDVLRFNAALDAGDLREAETILDRLFLVTSPYLAFDIKKWAGWELLLKTLMDKDVKPENKPAVLALYQKITPALAESVRLHPYEPQVYYVLGSLYREGHLKLGQTEDLAKSEAVLRQALVHSAMRIEYIDAMGQTLIAAKKFDELEALMQRFISQLDPEDSYRYLSLGNYYYLLEKYDLAFEQYVKAQEHGYSFLDTVFDRDYDRYLFAAQETRNFEKAVQIIRLHLEKKGPDAANYFNLAVAYIKMGNKEEAQKAYAEAAKLDSAGYAQYASFFK